MPDRDIRLTACLAERLCAVVPEIVRVSVLDGFVRVESLASGFWTDTDVAGIISGGHSKEHEALTTAAYAVLNRVQDFIIEELGGDSWPIRADQPSVNLALPSASVADGKLVLWYGDRDHPTLRLRDIDFTEL